MSLELTVPHSTAQGYKYLLQFSEFNQAPLSVSVPIVDVQIVSVSEIKEAIGLKTLFYFSQQVLEYMNNNDVILYCYCAHSEISTARKGNEMSPQEYRHTLFSFLFERKADDNFILENLHIKDEKYGDHFISLITKTKNSKEILSLQEKIKELEK